MFNFFSSGCYRYSRGGGGRCYSNRTLHRAARCSASVVSTAILAQRSTSTLEKHAFFMESSVHLPKLDRLSFQTICCSEVSGELSAFQITGASTGAEGEEFGCQRQKSGADMNPEVDDALSE